MLRGLVHPAPAPALKRRLAAALGVGDEPQGIPQAARTGGFSTRGIFRAARQALGESPAAYSRRCRLDAAALALLAGRETILEIALAHGFASHETFTRAFQRQFGLAPSLFRRSRASQLRPALRSALGFAQHLGKTPSFHC